MVVNDGYCISEVENVHSETSNNNDVITKPNDIGVFTYEEALDVVGHGFYNKVLLAILSIALVAMALDMFGVSIIVVGCGCEFDLTIQQKSIITSVPLAGPVLMSYAWGYLADTQGRHKILTIAIGGSFTFAVLSCLSPNWIALATMKFISSSFGCCIQSVSYTLLGECTVQSVRANYMLAMSVSLMVGPFFYYGLGYFILPLNFSYNMGLLGQFTAWRLLSLMFAVPLGICLVGMLFIYESPKFLSNLGYDKKALDIFKKIWIKNGGDACNYPIKKIVLCEKNRHVRRGMPFLTSLWEQTVPLFQPPYLMRTLHLFYLCATLYSTNNGFTVWFPLIMNIYFMSAKSASNNSTLCDVLLNHDTLQHSSANNTAIEPCRSTLEDNTILGGVIFCCLITTASILIIYVSSRRKVLMIVILLLSAIAGSCVTLISEPVVTLTFYILFLFAGLGCGIVSSYFVEWYPTSHRGMASCLGVMIARLSGLIGTSTVGLLMMSHCQITFYSWSAFVLSGAAIALLLPPDKPLAEKTKI